MKGIGEFFKRIQNIHTKELFLRTQIKEGIKNVTKASIELDRITVKGNTIVLKNINPVLKSVIYTKKTEILKSINSLQDIRVFENIS